MVRDMVLTKENGLRKRDAAIRKAKRDAKTRSA